jgi:DNA replication protein DnaC
VAEEQTETEERGGPPEPLVVSEYLKERGEVDCPGCGKPNGGLAVVMFGREVTIKCDECTKQDSDEQEAAEQVERVQDMLSRAGATPRLEQFTLDTYPSDPPHAEAKRIVLEWRDRILEAEVGKPGAPNLVLYGNVGGGKSGLMWPIVKSFCQQERRARYVDFPSLLEQMKAAYQHKVPFDAYSTLGRVPVLVLDDVGAERPTEWARSELLHLVNLRYERLLPTAYVSNYEPDELVERLGHDDPMIGERIVSRMNEGAIQHRLRARDLRVPA